MAGALTTAIVASPAAADWREASTTHFVIYADTSEGWLRDYASRLERFASALKKLQPGGWASGGTVNRVGIYVLPTIGQLHDLAGRDGVGGYYKSRVGTSVIFIPITSSFSVYGLSPTITLQHEYTHHFMLSTAKIGYPFWYVEGFAEFFGNARVQEDGSVEIGRPAEHRKNEILNGFLKVEDILSPKGSGTLLYGKSWLLTHMLTFDKSRAGQLDKYLAALNSGSSSVAAAREAFGDLSVLQKQLDGYARKNLTYSVLPASATTVGPISIRALTIAEATIMPVRIRSENGVTRTRAAAVVSDARRLAAPFPNDPIVQTALAEAEFDADNLPAAEAAADRAIAADPKNREALLYKGRILMARAQQSDATAPTRWQEARRWFVKANRAEPDAPEPLMLFYTSYLTAGERPPEGAVAGLERAFEFSPHSPELRMLVARQYLIENDMKTARSLLSPIAIDQHGSKKPGLAAKMIEMIDAKRSSAEILAAKIEKDSVLESEKH